METNITCNCPKCGKNNWNVEFTSDFEFNSTFDKFDEMYVDGNFIFRCTVCGFVIEFTVGD